MEKQKELKNGGCVELKSGGPEMTINEVVEQPFFSEAGKVESIPVYVNCSWFDKAKLMSGRFYIDALMLVK